jgi:two-component system, cell cycle sensor histidine kinase and response regulator CckA
MNWHRRSPVTAGITMAAGMSWRVPLAAAMLYALLGGLWILLSDRVAGVIFSDPDTLSMVQTYKGLFYIVLTTALVYWLVSGARKNALRGHELYRSLFENSHAVMLVTDPDTGSILDANPAARRWYGWDHAALRSMRIGQLAAPETEAGEVRQSVPGKQTHMEHRHRRADGSVRDVDVHSSPVRLGGRSLLFLIVFDITERKSAEEEKARLEEQLLQSQKMEAVGLLAGGVAHDFNNLLQVINGYTDLVTEALGPDHPAHDNLCEIQKAGARAATLVTQLLAFSRRQVMRPASLDVNEVVASLIKMMSRIIGEHIRLEFVPAANVSRVHADRGMLDQVLLNLCVNGRDAMPNGGTLTIETREVLVDGEYCRSHSWATPGRYVLLSVTDTGCGMDPDTLGRVFEPFFTTKEPGKGTGLGLATVYGIVKQHGGMVQAYSEPDKGTLFKVYLPAGEALAREVGAPIEGRAEGGGETVLLAEDDAMVRGFAELVLRQAGYTVLTACDGGEAVAIFQDHAHRIGLVILDVVMPVRGGREACRVIRGIRPEVPVLFASGYSVNSVHTGFVLHEDTLLIQKPFTRDELLRMARRAIAREPRMEAGE